jgi:hypothetical protein
VQDGRGRRWVGEAEPFQAERLRRETGGGPPARRRDSFAPERAGQRIEIGHRREQLLEADVGVRDRCCRHAGRQHRQHRCERPQRDLAVIGRPAELAGGDAVDTEHHSAGQPGAPLEAAQRPPGGRSPLQPLALVPGSDPIAQAEHAHLLGGRWLPREAKQVPATPQGVGGRAGSPRLLSQPDHQRTPDRHQRDQYEPADPPPEGHQDDAREDPGQAVAELRDQRHRRARGIAAEQLAPGGGELPEHLLVLEVLDPGRRADRDDEPALHQGIDASASGGRQRVLGGSAHQRQRIRGAGLHEREDQDAARMRRHPEQDRPGDRARDPAHRHQDEHGQDALGDDEQHRRDAQQRAGAPQQEQRADPARARQAALGEVCAIGEQAPHGDAEARPRTRPLREAPAHRSMHLAHRRTDRRRARRSP